MLGKYSNRTVTMKNKQVSITSKRQYLAVSALALVSDKISAIKGNTKYVTKEKWRMDNQQWYLMSYANTYVVYNNFRTKKSMKFVYNSYLLGHNFLDGLYKEVACTN